MFGRPALQEAIPGHSPARFEIDSYGGARQQWHTRDEVRAVIVPVGYANLEDLYLSRGVFDLCGEIGKRPEVGMRVQPKVQSHRLNCPSWAPFGKESA